MVYVLSEKFPRAANLIWLYPLLMSFSRIYVLQHYPLDVIGGCILGNLLGWLCIKKAKTSMKYSYHEKSSFSNTLELIKTMA